MDNFTENQIHHLKALYPHLNIKRNSTYLDDTGKRKIFPEKQRELYLKWKEKNPEKYKVNCNKGMPKVWCDVCEKHITYRQYKPHLTRSRHLKLLEKKDNDLSSLETISLGEK